MASAFLSGFFFLFSHFSRILPIQSVERYSDKRDDKDLHSGRRLIVARIYFCMNRNNRKLGWIGGWEAYCEDSF